MPLTPEATAYQHARAEWRAFRSATFATSLLTVIRHPAITDPEEIAAALRVLPAAECRPVAFAIAMKAGGGWSSATLDRFCGEFLHAWSPIECQTLEAIVSRRVTAPEKLPATVETYPSRIWQRALAHQNPVRLTVAAFLATHAIETLLIGSGCHDDEEDEDEFDDDVEADSGAACSFSVPLGDLDSVFDLVAIAPSEFAEMKNRLWAKLETDTVAGTFVLLEGQISVLRAWVQAKPDLTSAAVEAVLDEARGMRDEHTRYGGLRARVRTMRYGRFLLRLGLRREALRCARAIGITPWEHGWQQQALSAKFHRRIRNLIIKPGMETDRWLTEPALACSFMAVPLWLQDGICRIPDLITLFGQARECAWLYPQLHQIFQWHLALAGNHQALCEIAEIDPEGQIGLAVSSPTQG
jgi:hypothetical protein